jgi:hypothetical protein
MEVADTWDGHDVIGNRSANRTVSRRSVCPPITPALRCWFGQRVVVLFFCYAGSGHVASPSAVRVVVTLWCSGELMPWLSVNCDLWCW